MILHCKSCKNKFSVIDQEITLEGKIVQCRHCDEQWIYESKTRYLENRLAELGEDLNKTEIKLNIKKDEHKNKIVDLENNLKTKIDELENQKKLEEKVLAFEMRLSNTEKNNSEQKELETKISNIENEIKLTHEGIYNKNKDIEKKTNYIESKINSFNDIENLNVNDETNKISVNSNDVINIRPLDLENKQNKKKLNETKKKFNFFRPS
tara:strand:+ start:687 stop:1313 length:627 start_codon:yes stop_codon:yes gene_type:complete